MKKDDSIYLDHILNCIHKILDYTKGISEKEFFSNPIIQDAVIRQFEIIGESTKRISIQLKNKYEKIPWQDVAGMRDKLIHDYIDVDLYIVWRTIIEDVPQLKNQIENVLGEI